MLEKRNRLSQRAITPHRQRGDVAAAVVRDEHRFARGIDLDIAGGGAARVLTIERPQISPTALDGKCGDEIVLPAELVDGIQERWSGESAIKNGFCTPVVRFRGISVPFSESKPNA